MRRNLRSYKRSHKRKIKEPNEGGKFALLLFGSVFIGFISGFVYACLSPNGSYGIFDGIGSYLSDFPVLPALRFEMLADSFIKYGKFIAAVWFMAFLPIGALIVFLILFIKGFSLGFATGALIAVKGFPGVFLSLYLTLPQNLVFIPALLLVGFRSASASIEKELSNNLRTRGLKRKPETARPGYFFTLIMGLAAVLLIAIYEAYAVPWLVSAFN